MDLGTETEKRDLFKSILFDLSESEEIVSIDENRKRMYERLENLYDAPKGDKPFRHFYSDIFFVLTELEADPERGNINYLGSNIKFLRENYREEMNTADDGHLINISKSLDKLYDHVSLDIARLEYSKAGDWKVSQEKTVQELQGQINEINSTCNILEDMQEDIKNRIQSQQKEYIAILSIFSAVVLSFTAGIAFSTSVLENIAEVSAYRIIIIALVIGLVILNIIFGLFYFTNKIVRNEEKLGPLRISNAVFVSLILLVTVAWYCGAIESRNERVQPQVAQESTENVELDFSYTK